MTGRVVVSLRAVSIPRLSRYLAFQQQQEPRPVCMLSQSLVSLALWHSSNNKNPDPDFNSASTPLSLPKLPLSLRLGPWPPFSGRLRGALLIVSENWGRNKRTEGGGCAAGDGTAGWVVVSLHAVSIARLSRSLAFQQQQEPRPRLHAVSIPRLFLSLSGIPTTTRTLTPISIQPAPLEVSRNCP